MTNVLLLGDSIRIHYQARVIEELGAEFSVSAPEENCRFSGYTLNCLRWWLQDLPRPDIIHWNNGLWDTNHIYPEDGCFTPIEEYLINLKKILRVLKKTGAKIIFATTTPVSVKRSTPRINDSTFHINGEIAEYNKRALELMKSENIPVNDLFTIINADIEKYICDDLIHPSEDGIMVLGKAVANAIKFHRQNIIEIQ